MKPKDSNSIHNSPPPVPIPNQINLVHALPTIRWTSMLILSSHLRLRLPSSHFSSGSPSKPSTYLSSPLSYHMNCASHSPWFDYPGVVRSADHELVTVQLPAASSFLVPLRPKYIPQHLLSNIFSLSLLNIYQWKINPSAYVPLSMWQCLHRYRTRGKTKVLHISSFIFFGSKLEDKRFWTQR